MTISIKAVVDAFRLLHESLRDPAFAKSTRFSQRNERQLLTLVRTFLLGRFGKVSPEVAASLPGCPSGTGRIDFCIGDLAVELAVRPSGGAKAGLCASGNQSELRKLLRHDGRALLVLFDFSKDALLTSRDLENYRKLPKLGSGSWRTSAFNVAYFAPGVPPRVINVRT